jgi:hypothetical protein
MIKLIINDDIYIGVPSMDDNGFTECCECDFFMKCMEFGSHCGFLGIDNIIFKKIHENEGETEI